MKTDKPRQLAVMILDRHVHGPQSADSNTEDLFRLFRLDERDRGFVNNLVQGVLRWRLRLDFIIEQFSVFPLKKIDENILNILRIAIYQILFLDKVPESAAVNEAVNLARADKRPRHIISFINGLLRTVCRRKHEIKYPDRVRERTRYLSVFYSYPDWLTDKWVRELGEDVTEALFKAENNFPDLNVRANTLRISRDALVETLTRDGIDSKPLAYSPDGIVLEGFRGRVDLLDAFRGGLFQVQDQAAQIASRLLFVEPGDRVLDVCAGFGGKSTHLAELMGGAGLVISLDINNNRRIKLIENAERLGITNITPVAADATQPLSSLFEYKFRRVIIDSPCSGLGVISRHPDIKWNRKADDIQRLAALQKALLKAAVPVVQNGGELLYVVCTISREENEEVVRDFLDSNKDMSLVNLKERVPPWGIDLIDDQGFYRTYPHIHNMDGFFAALFRKND
jgi:16S rRNA (cytosine967-C5)-methyltransferase